MGVANLWKALEKGGAVTRLDGAQPGDHALILQELENTAVAVDLSAWLVQAITQPALVGVLDSPHACVLKVVFDRVSRRAAAAAPLPQVVQQLQVAPSSATGSGLWIHSSLHGTPCSCQMAYLQLAVCTAREVVSTAGPFPLPQPLEHSDAVVSCSSLAAVSHADHPLAAPWCAAGVCH
jgi:hypothetical protein